ncbi:MAG: tetratricopeptide repeat protein [Bacteroidia bacterium]
MDGLRKLLRVTRPVMWVRLLVCCLGVCKAQSLDSLRAVVALGRHDTLTMQAAKQLAYFLQYEDLDAALHYGELSMRLAQELGDKQGLMRGIMTTGQVHLSAGRLDTALNFFQEAGRLAHELGNRKGIFNSYMNAGVAFDLKGEFVKSVDMLLHARKVAKEDGRTADVIDCDFNIGITLYKLENYTAARGYFEQASDEYLRSGNMMSYAATLDALGSLHVALKDYDKAESYYLKAVELGLKLEAGANLTPKYANLGSVYFFKKDYNRAIEYMTKALKMAEENGQQGLIADGYGNLSNCYRFTGNLPLAEKYGRIAFEMSMQMGNGETAMEALKNLIEVYVGLGEAEKALDCFRDLQTMKDSLRTEEAAAEVANLRLKSAQEQNAQELLEAENARLSAEASAARSGLWLAVALSLAALLLLTLVIVVAVLRSRKHASELLITKKEGEFARKKLELEQRALRAQMNPHFIFNSLNAIQRLYVERDLDRAGEYMGDFAQLLRKILDHSGSETVTLAAELDTLRLYLRLEQVRLEDKLAFEIVVDEELDRHNTWLPPLVLQPFVENAIWHGILPTGRAGTVRVEVRPADEETEPPRLEVCITDDGVGIDNSLNRKQASGHESKGIRITSERLGAAGSVKSEQLPEGGTRITLLIPVTYI